MTWNPTMMPTGGYETHTLPAVICSTMRMTYGTFMTILFIPIYIPPIIISGDTNSHCSYILNNIFTTTEQCINVTLYLVWVIALFFKFIYSIITATIIASDNISRYLYPCFHIKAPYLPYQ